MFSTRQSSKELSECRTTLVTFLRDYHHQIYNPTPQGLLGTCHTLCMLTRQAKAPKIHSVKGIDRLL